MFKACRIPRLKNIIIASVPIVFFLIAAFAVDHGPKGHSGGDFTALQDAKKGMQLYDQLVSSGKLEESWETKLTGIEITQTVKNNKKELVVKFSRSESEPKTVFIFFTEKGDYIGSNFTGK